MDQKDAYKGKTSIIILSCNTLQHTKNCLASIRQYTPAGTYELIVVDNGSADGSVSWLRTQSDVRCIFNKENQGFPRGCNQGMRIAEGTELLLLNSDTIVTPRWLEQLRIALYSDADIGAVGCVTNHCSERQQIDIPYHQIEDMQAFAESYNHTDPAKWEKCLKLVGFCLLLRREVYEAAGELDEQFSPGNYEDDDYCLRIWQAGWQLLLCQDTFIYHVGNASFLQTLSQGQRDEKIRQYNALLDRNALLFRQKWQIPEGYNELQVDLVNTMLASGRLPQRLLEADCGCGADLLWLQSQFRQMELSGVTSSAAQAAIGSRAAEVVFCQDIEQNLWPHIRQYDCILVTDILKGMRDGESFIYHLVQHLTDEGVLYFLLDGQVYTLNREAVRQ